MIRFLFLPPHFSRQLNIFQVRKIGQKGLYGGRVQHNSYGGTEGSWREVVSELSTDDTVVAYEPCRQSLNNIVINLSDAYRVVG